MDLLSSQNSFRMVGVVGSSYQSDVAIDDITVTTGTCAGSQTLANKFVIFSPIKFENIQLCSLPAPSDKGGDADKCQSCRIGTEIRALLFILKIQGKEGRPVD